jgi:hypothetical protein
MTSAWQYAGEIYLKYDVRKGYNVSQTRIISSNNEQLIKGQ